MRRGLGGPPPSGGGWGALSELSGVIRLTQSPHHSPPLQLTRSPALPAPHPRRDKEACSRGVRPPAPSAGPARVPPAGIAPGAGSQSRPALTPAPDFPRSGFSLTNEGERKNARLPRARAAPGPGGNAGLAWVGGDAKKLRARPVSAPGLGPGTGAGHRRPRRGRPNSTRTGHLCLPRLRCHPPCSAVASSKVPRVLPGGVVRDALQKERRLKPVLGYPLPQEGQSPVCL